MTREEFLAQRAMMDFTRRQGVTQCPPGAAMGTDAAAGRRYAFLKTTFTLPPDTARPTRRKGDDDGTTVCGSDQGAGRTDEGRD